MSERALVGNAADVKQVKKAKQYEKLQADRERADLRTILESESGRRDKWKELCDAGIFRLSYVPGDSHATAFNEGRRSHGLTIFHAITQIDPALLYKMAKEAQDLERAYNPEPKSEQKQAETEQEETES